MEKEESQYKSTAAEVVRFMIAGGVAIGVHFGTYYLLNIWLSYNFSYTAGYVLSIIVHYFITALFTFKSNAGVKNGAGYFICQGLNYLLQMVLLNLFIHWGVSESLAPVPTYAIAGPVNYLCLKLVFKFLK